MQRVVGFSTVELLITIAILVALLSIGTLSLRGSQVNARDAERKNDIESIARGLEIRYRQGNPKATSSDIALGAYPGTNEIRHAQGTSFASYTPNQISDGYLTDLLPGTVAETFVPPNGGTFEAICTSSCPSAEDTTTINAAVTSNKYIYEPITSAGAICSANDCVRFNLYYRAEADSTVKKVMSKNQ